MKRLILLVVAVAGFALAYAQGNLKTCRGTVIDELGEPMVGVTVQGEGTQIGVPTDIDGNFTIKLPESVKKVKFTYIGYKTKTVPAASVMGNIKLDPDSKMLQDVVVTQSKARTRETPVAISELTAGDIEAKLGNKEFPEVLKSTPGVWATPDGGGYGDAKINMRGFKAPNVAVLINGVPMNDMEWGGIYWSNFAGLSGVTSSMQTQRGLGAAIISAPSIGGTINITTKGLDAKKGGSVWYGTGNDGLNDVGMNVSTGLMSNGWAITVLGSKKWANGYIQGTSYEAYNYFVNVSKRINNNHQISLTAFGAPQWHNQRNNGNGLTIENWQAVKQYMGEESPYRYNASYGFDNEGRERTMNRNQYHKPIISLNHIWQITPMSSLSTALYTSLSTGGGYSGQGRGSYSNSSWYAATNGNLNWTTGDITIRRPDGTFDYGAIQDMNAASDTGSNMVMSMSNNAHEWYGLVSTYKNEIIPNKLAVLGGIDLRYYVGHHNNKIIDLYSGEYFMDDSSRKNVKPANNAAAADPNWKYQKLGVGDVVYRDYDGFAYQEGAYAQGEYKLLDGAITTFLSGSLNVTSYQREDHFYYDKEHAKSPTKSFLGGTVKGGVNWNIDAHQNVFLNGGFISKAPFFSNGVFLSSATSNAINPNPKNEKIASVEGGYGFHSPKFTMTANVYYTKWMDRTDRDTQRSGEISSGAHAGERYTINLENVQAQHIGVEVDFAYKPTKWVEFQGMFSWGDWKWNNNAKGYFYNDMGQPLKNTMGDLASGIKAEDHAWAIVNQKNVKIGGSAQTTGALGVTFRPFKGFRIGGDWTMCARNYSDYQVSGSDLSAGAILNVESPWEIPWGNEFDLNASYKFKMAGLDATLYGNVYNLFNYYYVKDATTNYNVVGTWSNAYKVLYSFGRTFSLRLKINF